MILYHGSTQLVSAPEIRHGSSFLDFGIGFYTTSSYEQAARWAKIKMGRTNLHRGFVSVYDFDLCAAEKTARIRRFENADLEWLMFVVKCRRGEAVSSDCDMLIGPVADDNVYQSIKLFETGVFSAEDTVQRLKTEVLHDQWAFHTEKVLSLCKFIRADEVISEDRNEQ